MHILKIRWQKSNGNQYTTITRLVLFGGNRVLFGTGEKSNTFLDDMWAWDGQVWSQIHTKTPSARAEAGIAYDTERNRIVLFGGYRTVDGERTRLGDTWEWDGEGWAQISSIGPSARNGVAMAYDAHRRRVVLFGGSGAPDETWEWDGKVWKQIVSAQIDGRFNSAMSYDTARQSLIRFGGYTREGRVGDTWRYEDSQWTRITSDGPAGRNHAAMAYDSQRKVIVLFGGHDGVRVFGDTWEWDGTTWLLREQLAPRLRINNGH